MADKSTPEQRDAIYHQMLVAFGQGTGSMRVSRSATEALRSRYQGWVDDNVVGQWDAAGTHVLERLRAIGRKAGSSAAAAGRTMITDADVAPAMTTVESASRTDLCPPPPSS
jgi:hypothetical protein